MVFLQNIIAILLSLTGKTPPASPPVEPDFEYDYAYTVTQAGSCVDGSRVWIYEPIPPTPTSNEVEKEKHDVVVYLHGYSAVFPTVYQGHIIHLVQQGHVVVFPQLQNGYCWEQPSDLFVSLVSLFNAASPAEWARRASRVAQDTLDQDLRVAYNNVYLYGHSLGGAFAMMWGSLAADMEITAAVLSSPQPAGFDAIPGYVTTLLPFLFGEDIDVPALAPATKFPVAVLHGSDDTIAPLTDILASYESLGSTEKAIYQAQSDDHGRPVITADHTAPISIGVLNNRDVNTLDWRYFWSALDQVMAGTPVTELSFDMGKWSDGVAVAVVERVD